MKQCHTVACFVSVLYLTPSIDPFLATVCICRTIQRRDIKGMENVILRAEKADISKEIKMVD